LVGHIIGNEVMC